MDSETPTPDSSTAQIQRGKTDPAWAHCREVPSDDKSRNHIICLYCEKLFKGGGINRFKQHLAGRRKDAVPCPKVSAQIRFEMEKALESVSTTKKRGATSEQSYSESNLRDYEEELYGSPEILSSHTSTSAKGKGKKIDNPSKKLKTINTVFMPRTTPGGQPSLRSVLQTKEAKEKVDLVISKWMIDGSISFNAANSVYFQEVFDAATSYGPGYKAPTFHALRGYLLRKNVEQVKDYVDSYRVSWKQTGCTIMADGWSDNKRRTLINFLVYCPRGTVFLKSVDASDVSKTKELLFNLFKEVILDVGVENVVHIVTDNASNFVAAGKLLETEFPSLSWSPCAAHCLNLMFQDMGKLEEVSNLVDHASKITRYVYNHSYPLYLMRKHTGGREILRPGPTRFATNFIALQSILAHKDALRAMVTSQEWKSSSYAKNKQGKRFEEWLFDSNFWKECATIVQLTDPLMRVLRLVDSDERPSMGSLYAAIHKAKQELVKRFQKKKKKVETYLKIIDDRWDKQLFKNLHAAGFWFNPAHQYNADDMEQHGHTGSSFLDVIEKYAHGNPTLRAKLTRESSSFRQAESDFGRPSAIHDRDIMRPDEWWRCYGNGAPNLQKLAIRVLSQSCSASGCERNWSIFQHIHSKKRNRLEHQRLNDLVYVHYNLRLQQKSAKGRNYDPIDYGEFSLNGNWVLEDDPPILTVEELETYRKELSDFDFQALRTEERNEPLNLDDLDVDDEDQTNAEENNEDDQSNAEENDDGGNDGISPYEDFGGYEMGTTWEKGE